MDHRQEQSWNQLRCLYRGQSRVRDTATAAPASRTMAVLGMLLLFPRQLSILSELSHGNEKAGLLIGSQAGTAHFQLKLAPPPLFEE